MAPRLYAPAAPTSPAHGTSAENYVAWMNRGLYGLDMMSRESTHPAASLFLDLPVRPPVRARRSSQPFVPQFMQSRSSHPRWVRAVNALGGSFEPVGRPSGDVWWERAMRLNPDAGEPTPDTRVALDAFTESLNEDAALSFIGKIAAWLDCTRMASTHLRVEHALRQRPEIVHTQLPRPIFVLGLFRSGTTVLHRMLAQDPDNRTLPHWESFDPSPAPEGPARAQRSLSRSLMLADLISPNIKAIHPMDAYQADECRGMFTNVFRTPQLNVQFRATGYLDWLFRQDATIAYRHHRRQLQLAFHQRPHGKRIVLKDPTHTFFIDAIRRVFPNARFVFIHRDPAETMSSICSLHAYARSVFSSDVDARAIGGELANSYLVERLEHAVDSADRLAPGRIAHLRASDLGRDPVGTIASVYTTLGIELTPQARERIRRYAADSRMRNSVKHIHAADGFGLDRGAIRERLASYCQRFDL